MRRYFRAEFGARPLRQLRQPLVLGPAVLVVLSLIAACGGDDAAPPDELVRLPAPTANELAEALREGGLVIYFRHGATDQAQADNDGPELADCGLQRNLSNEGREQSAEIGRQVSRLEVPIGEVLSSRYCRALDTARLAFGEATISDDLTGYLAHTSTEEKQRRLDALHSLLKTQPEDGNTVLVAHQYNLEDLLGVLLLEGEAAIFQPGDEGELRLLAQLKVEEWATLPATESIQR